jgi:hypothetical protein
MKGFKPTGFGPMAGFHFPSKMGFTGSTGMVTPVAPYVRRRAFANGGFVRQGDMKTENVGDQGSALVRRKKAYAQWQDDVGAHSSLLPGFKDGGHNWIKGAIKHPGALHKALGVPEGKKIPAKKMAKAAHSSNPTMRRRAALAKTLKKMHKADGGAVDEYEKPTYMQAFKDRFKEFLRVSAPRTGMARQAADKITGRQKQIDDVVDQAVTGKKNYARGGKMKRMGYAMGGVPMTGYAPTMRRPMIQSPPMGAPSRMVATPRAPMTTMARAKGGMTRYAKGGAAHSDEAQDRPMMKRIAQEVIGEHVRYPAPKGHKGLGSMINAKRR